MARTLDFDKTKALEAAIRVFARKGFGGASLSELEEAMGIGRASLYNTFESKAGLFYEALEHYATHIMDAQYEEATKSNPDTFDRLRTILRESATRRPSIVTLGILERALHDRRTRARLTKQVRDPSRRTVLATIAAQEAGDIDADVDAEGLAVILAAVAAGLKVLAGAGFSEQELDNGIETLIQILDDRE